MARSIVQEEKECFICESTYGLEKHHCLHGWANRRIADNLGLTVYLCKQHHTELHDRNHDLDLFVQQAGQRAYEEHIGSREEFRRLFGKSYL